MSRSKVSIIIILIFLLFTTGCIDKMYESFFKSVSKNSNTGSNDIKTENVNINDINLEYGRLDSKYPSIQYDYNKDALTIPLKITLPPYTFPSRIDIREIKSGWQSYIYKVPTKYLTKSNETYLLSDLFIILSLGFEPEFEICYSNNCTIKKLPPLAPEIEIEPSIAEIESEAFEIKESKIMIKNNGIFPVNVQFQAPKDEDKKATVLVSSDAYSLNPGQSTQATVKVYSKTTEPFEFSTEVYFVEYRNNLGEYYFKKPILINVKQDYSK